MKHEIFWKRILFLAIFFNFCIENISLTKIQKLEPSLSVIESSIKENKINRFNSENTIPKDYEDIKKSLVIIKSRPEVPFISDTDEIISTNGFLVDIKKGLIITTRKAARISPAFIKIQFYDGTITQGKVIYSDNIVPFGIIQVNESLWDKEKSKYKSLKLGDCNDDTFIPNMEIDLIGMSMEGTYINKKGKIINSNRNFSTRYGALFQTSFDRATNLNGSPVMNYKKEVIGMHVLGTSTTSYELKINHVKNILKQIVNNSPIKKGDIGISIDLVILGIAKSNYKLKDEIAEEISKNIIISGGPPEVMLISSVLPSSNSNNILKSGDILYKVNNIIIGNDFLKLENEINDCLMKNKPLNISVSRNSDIINLIIPNVDNSQDYLIDKYITFAGGYFHDVTKLVKYYLFSDLEGVYLTYNSVGSPFSKISTSNQSNKSNYILTAINSVPIKNIDELVEFFKNNCDLESIYVEGIDYNVFSGKLNSDAVDLDFNNSLLQKYVLSKSQFKWDVESWDLKQYCKTIKKNNINDEKTRKNLVAMRENNLNNLNITNVYNNQGMEINKKIELIVDEKSNINEDLFFGGKIIKDHKINYLKNNNSTKILKNKNEKILINYKHEFKNEIFNNSKIFTNKVFKKENVKKNEFNFLEKLQNEKKIELNSRKIKINENNNEKKLKEKLLNKDAKKMTNELSNLLNNTLRSNSTNLAKNDTKKIKREISGSFKNTTIVNNTKKNKPNEDLKKNMLHHLVSLHRFSI